MAWSLSGSTITQSGTDTDLSGLAGIAGVTTSVLPTVRGLTLYNLGGLTLSVNGELGWNPETEACVTTNNKALTVAGTLRINGAIERDGVKTYSQQYWLRSSAVNNGEAGGHSPLYAIIHVLSSGTLIWEGGYVAKAGSIVFDSGSTIRITSGGWNCHAHFATYPDQVRQFTTNVQVEGFAFLDGGMWTDIAKPGDPFTGLTFAHAYGYGASNNSYDGEFHLRRDYSAVNEKQQSGFWSDLWNRFINSEKGSDAIVIGTSAASTGTNVGVWEAVKELKLTLQADTVATVGTKAWVVDTDDGFRQNWTKAFGTINYTDDRTYLETTTATAGNASETDVFSVLLASAVRQTGGTAGTNDAGLNKKSYRGKNGDTSDVFEVRFCGYETQLKQTDLVLKGNGVLNATDKLFADLSITEQNPATVAAYTDITTAARLYDRAKLWLLDNYVGETETLITRSANTIDLRGLNIVIDPDASAAFAFDGAAITINASTFTGNLTTTGTVTLLNGATVDGAVEDANGVRVTIRRADGLAFNMVARHGTEGDYVDLGFHENTTSQTFTVSKGRPVEFALKTKGWATMRRALQTDGGGVVFDAEPVLNEAVDTSIDVSSYLADITLTNGGGVFNFVFEADMDIPGIEVAKTLIDTLVAQELALRSTLPPGMGTIIDILSDEVRINQPVVQLILGVGANNVTQRGFVNIAPALAVDPSYVINPRRLADNLRVDLPLNKPTLDPSVLALAVRGELAAELGRIDVAVSTRLAETDYTTPSNADIAAIKAKTDTLENYNDAATQTKLDNLDTAIDLTLKADDYTAPDNTSITAIKAKVDTLENTDVSDLATASQINALNDITAADVVTAMLEVADDFKADVSGLALEATLETKASQTSVNALGTPLQATDYLAPRNDDIVAIKAKTDTLVNAPTVADIEASTVLAKEATLANKLDAADYVEPDNATIAAIKTKVDTLENTDVSALATSAEIQALNNLSSAEVVDAMLLQADSFKADVSDLATSDEIVALGTMVGAVETKVEAVETKVDGVETKVDAVKAVVDELENTDLTAIESSLTDIKGAGFNPTKHNLVKIKQDASLAAALSAL